MLLNNNIFIKLIYKLFISKSNKLIISIMIENNNIDFTNIY